jgi:8-oxo-dGTP pyrophosphatase MutT (NUDIX family)
MSHAGDDDLEERLRARLDPLEFSEDWSSRPPRGDFDLNPQFRPAAPRALNRAAVLAGIVRRPEGYTLLLTQRTNDMPTHAGQVAFPGGRLQEGDAGPVAAALREAEEEIGLAPRFVHPIGAFDAYETVTGFCIAPIVALVEPGFTLRADPREVADIFEAPLSFLFDPRNHERHEREWGGGTRAYYVMPFQNRFIWGATAGMIRALYRRLYEAAP